jgi:hypothetical protein
MLRLAGRGGMQITYQYRCDLEYFKTVIDRQYRQGHFLLRLPIQFGVVGAICASFVFAATDTSMIVRATLFIVIFCLVLVTGVMATRQGLLMKFKSRAGFGSDVAVTLSEEGVAVGIHTAEQRLVWSTYPSSIRFSDGILLKKPGSIRWLPDSAIQLGSSSEATSLVGSKTLLRYVH